MKGLYYFFQINDSRLIMQSRYISIIVLIFFFAVTVIPSSAGWVDDWLDQHTTASQGYFSGQQRGYYTFGSFSGRMSTGSVNPISIAPPRLSVGCGGIDAFLGSMSFVNFEYLVQKLQTIMQNAPVIAFEMALGVLSEQMKNTLNQVEEFLNSLNNIQINECQASKALVATLDRGLLGGKLGSGESAAGYLTKSGVKDVYYAATELIKSVGGDPAQVTDGTTPVGEKLMEGCPQDFKDVFGTEGSLLNNIADKLGIVPEYVDLIRGLAGDINIKLTGGMPQGIKMPPCKNNNQFVLDDFLKGTVEKQDASWQCTQINDLNKEIDLYVSNQMLTIMSNMINGSSLTTEQQDFIDTLPIPLYPVLKSSVGTGQEGVILSLMSNVAARAYVFMMLADAYKMFHDVIDEGQRVMTAIQGADTGQDEYRCELKNFKEIKSGLIEMKDVAYQLTTALRGAYSNSASEVNSILELVSRMQNVKDQVHYLVSTRYGQQVADRAMGGVSQSSSN